MAGVIQGLTDADLKMGNPDPYANNPWAMMGVQAGMKALTGQQNMRNYASSTRQAASASAMARLRAEQELRHLNNAQLFASKVWPHIGEGGRYKAATFGGLFGEGQTDDDRAGAAGYSKMPAPGTFNSELGYRTWTRPGEPVPQGSPGMNSLAGAPVPDVTERIPEFFDFAGEIPPAILATWMTNAASIDRARMGLDQQMKDIPDNFLGQEPTYVYDPATGTVVPNPTTLGGGAPPGQPGPGLGGANQQAVRQSVTRDSMQAYRDKPLTLHELENLHEGRQGLVDKTAVMNAAAIEKTEADEHGRKVGELLKAGYRIPNPHARDVVAQQYSTYEFERKAAAYPDENRLVEGLTNAFQTVYGPADLRTPDISEEVETAVKEAGRLARRDPEEFAKEYPDANKSYDESGDGLINPDEYMTMVSNKKFADKIAQNFLEGQMAPPDPGALVNTSPSGPFGDDPNTPDDEGADDFKGGDYTPHIDAVIESHQREYDAARAKAVGHAGEFASKISTIYAGLDGDEFKQKAVLVAKNKLLVESLEDDEEAMATAQSFTKDAFWAWLLGHEKSDSLLKLFTEQGILAADPARNQLILATQESAAAKKKLFDINHILGRKAYHLPNYGRTRQAAPQRAVIPQ